MKTIKYLAVLICSLSVLTFLAGCGNKNLPEFYGIFAVDGGKPIPLKEGEEARNFSPKVQFILFDKTIALGAAGDVKVYGVPLKPKTQQIDDGSFTWNKWNTLLESQQRQFTETMEGIPSDAIKIDTLQKPIEGKSEMIRIVPSVVPALVVINLDGYRSLSREMN